MQKNPGNITQFSYDALSRATKIEERTGGSVTSTKQHLWCGSARCEERDGTGSLSNGKRLLALGQINFDSGIGASYFYTADHLGSVREMTKTAAGSTTIEAQYGYDPYGQATKLAGSQNADFQYAEYYFHTRSLFNMPVFRAYNPNLARFVNRDPIDEHGGMNLYSYGENTPTLETDPLGTAPSAGGWELTRAHMFVRGKEVARAYFEVKIFPDFRGTLEGCLASCDKAKNELNKKCENECPHNPFWKMNCLTAVEGAYGKCLNDCANHFSPKPPNPDGDGGEPAPKPDNVKPFKPRPPLRKAS